MRTLYHITHLDRLTRAARSGVLTDESLETEGYIHCAYLEQVTQVMNRFFTAPVVVLLELEPGRLAAPVVDEGEPAYPHVYGPVPWGAVRRIVSVRRGEDGVYALPPSLDDGLSALLGAYEWYDHPEGPRFVETHRDQHRTSGHWLFLPGVISAFHQVLDGDELWLAQRGRLLLHVIDAHGALVTHRLGVDVAAGEVPVVSVPRAAWQAAELVKGEAFAFGTNVCAPPFSMSQWRLGEREELARAFPQHHELVTRLSAR